MPLWENFRTTDLTENISPEYGELMADYAVISPDRKSQFDPAGLPC